MNHLTIETDDSFSSLLELAANNDVGGFQRWIERDPTCVDEVGLWYGRQKCSKNMANEHRTPLMVASTYGSIDVIKLILAVSDVDVNRSCGRDKGTALHCAASGGSPNSVEVVKLLLAAGADPSLEDANGHCPLDVIAFHPKLTRLALEELLATKASALKPNLRITTIPRESISPPPSPTHAGNGSPLSPPESPVKLLQTDAPLYSLSDRKEYPIDPSLPDIKNSIYSTDEFRMYSFKVRPCSRAYSHDWTECPFVHPGENARRRDPRKFHYSCVPCPDFRKGACRRGDMCEYAHGVFECWLHPAQYRTRHCKDGTSCARRVCFFAHTSEELRPLYVSTGSAVPSPRSSTAGASAMDFAAAMNLLPGSPSSVSLMSPSPFTPPISPSGNGMQHSSVGWSQPNVPALHLPGSNLQSSRLRSSLNARDIPVEDYSLLQDFDVQQQQLLSEFAGLSQQPPLSNNSLSRSGRLKTLTPSNLDDIFSMESLSPRYGDQPIPQAVFSPTHKSAMLSQFQRQNMLSPINTNFTPKNGDHPLLQASFASGIMSPRNMEPISPLSSRVSMLAQREKQQQQQQHQQLRSLSSRELGTNSAAILGSPTGSWAKWGSSNGRPDWSVSADELGKLRTANNSFEVGNGEEPDLSWVQSLVKESPTDVKEKLAMPASAAISATSSSDKANANPQATDNVDHLMGSWIEQLQIDQLAAL